MIDWFRGSIPFLHFPVNGGHLFEMTPDGVVKWDIVKGVQVQGSHKSNISIRSKGSDGQGRATELWIDGNISKFLQGHNLFGSRNLIDLVHQTFLKIVNYHPDLEPRTLNLASVEQSILSGDFDVKSIDINQLYFLDNNRSVESWLYAAEMHASKRAGRSTSTRGTVYLGKNSRRWGLKFYNKKQEMLVNQNKDHPHFQKLITFAEGLLRVELRLLSLELTDLGLTKGRQFTVERLEKLFNSYLGRIDMTMNAHLIDEELINLPRTVQGTYHLWKSGVSCRQMLSKTSFFRHRKELKKYGVDINFPPLQVERNNVQPLIRVIEAKPVENPVWATELKLIA